MNKVLKLVVSVAVPELAGVVGSAFTFSAIADWYVHLAKPELAPPNWLFGPAWTTLYALMGLAMFLVWRKGLDRKDVRLALGIFLGQLVLNALWSVIFFGLRSPAGAFVEMVALWLAIVVTIVAFARVSRAAAWLLAPYILWVTFAGYLNLSIWMLN